MALKPAKMPEQDNLSESIGGALGVNASCFEVGVIPAHSAEARPAAKFEHATQCFQIMRKPPAVLRNSLRALAKWRFAQRSAIHATQTKQTKFN